MGTKKRHPWDMVGAYPTCPSCGVGDVMRDAWACWSMASQGWQLKSIFDSFHCDNCGDQTTPGWELDQAFRKSRIRRLNDQLRRGHADSATVVITTGVQAKGDAFVQKTLRALAGFEAFDADNDPQDEHDFGAFEIDEEKLFFKIDYFDPDLERHSDDAADPTCTHRVLTLMLASEY